MRLPAELRNQIWALASDAVHVVILRHDLGHDLGPGVYYSGSALRLLCKQTSEEALAYVNTPGKVHIASDVHTCDFFSVIQHSLLSNASAYHTIEMGITMAWAILDDVQYPGIGGSYQKYDWVAEEIDFSAVFPGIRCALITSNRPGGFGMSEARKKLVRDAMASVFDNEALVLGFNHGEQVYSQCLRWGVIQAKS